MAIYKWTRHKYQVGIYVDTLNNGIFLGEVQRHMSHEEEQNFFFAAARLFWPEGCLRDFFGLKKDEGLLKAKIILKTARRPNKPGLSKK